MAERKDMPCFMPAIITLLAGKFTPAARVEVQKITLRSLYLKRSSMVSRSWSFKPEWWYATRPLKTWSDRPGEEKRGFRESSRSFLNKN
jgi:hypothetical protein